MLGVISSRHIGIYRHMRSRLLFHCDKLPHHASAYIPNSFQNKLQVHWIEMTELYLMELSMNLSLTTWFNPIEIIKIYLWKELILSLLCFKSFNLLLNSPVFVQYFHRCPLAVEVRAKRRKKNNHSTIYQLNVYANWLS